MIGHFTMRHIDPYAIQWYRELDIHKKISVKTSFHLLCGMKFEDVLKLFNLLEIITLFHGKLVSEGLIPPRPRSLGGDQWK